MSFASLQPPRSAARAFAPVMKLIIPFLTFPLAVVLGKNSFRNDSDVMAPLDDQTRLFLLTHWQGHEEDAQRARKSFDWVDNQCKKTKIPGFDWNLPKIDSAAQFRNHLTIAFDRIFCPCDCRNSSPRARTAFATATLNSCQKGNRNQHLIRDTVLIT